MADLKDDEQSVEAEDTAEVKPDPVLAAAYKRVQDAIKQINAELAQHTDQDGNSTLDPEYVEKQKSLIAYYSEVRDSLGEASAKGNNGSVDELIEAAKDIANQKSLAKRSEGHGTAIAAEEGQVGSDVLIGDSKEDVLEDKEVAALATNIAQERAAGDALDNNFFSTVDGKLTSTPSQYAVAYTTTDENGKEITVSKNFATQGALDEFLASDEAANIKGSISLAEKGMNALSPDKKKVATFNSVEDLKKEMDGRQQAISNALLKKYGLEEGEGEEVSDTAPGKIDGKGTLTIDNKAVEEFIGSKRSAKEKISIAPPTDGEEPDAVETSAKMDSTLKQLAKGAERPDIALTASHDTALQGDLPNLKSGGKISLS